MEFDQTAITIHEEHTCVQWMRPALDQMLTGF